MLDDFNQIPGSVEFLLMALAAWRVSVFLLLEGGPFGGVRRVRSWFGIDHTGDGTPLPYVGGGIGSLFACVWCMAFWQAIIALIVWVYAPYVVVGAAVWAGASLIDLISGWMNHGN